ncbi:hypothetical protein GCM10027180_31230 [Microbulbifer echini]
MAGAVVGIAGNAAVEANFFNQALVQIVFKLVALTVFVSEAD